MTKTIRLEAPCTSGTKFYIVSIVAAADRFTVNFQYGAVGGATKTGTKTPAPVDLARAEAMFDKLVKEKMTGESHYRAVEGETPEYIAPESAAPFTTEVLPPRLLNDVDEGEILSLVENPFWWVQIKHDGDRVQVHLDGGRVRLFSARSGKPRACPAAIEKAFSGGAMRSGIFDGELVGETLWLFDVLSSHGNDIRSWAYVSRYEFLSQVWGTLIGGTVKLVETAKEAHEKRRMIVAARDAHAEGVVFIKSLAPYQAGRPNKGGNNLRWKFKASASVIVSKQNAQRSVDIELADGTRIGSCTIPPNQAVPRVGQVIECEYLYCMGSLVQAVYKGVRHDVPREACTREQLKFKNGVDPNA